jgi:polyhydroxyalkanoate synthesis regulator phasin
MAEEQDNLVVRMLREIRSDTQDTRQRLTRVERHIEEIRDQMVTAMGVAGLASVATEKHGEGMDEIRDQIEALRRRVSELEQRV